MTTVLLPDFHLSNFTDFAEFLYGGLQSPTEDCQESDLVRCLQVGLWSKSTNLLAKPDSESSHRCSAPYWHLGEDTILDGNDDEDYYDFAAQRGRSRRNRHKTEASSKRKRRGRPHKKSNSRGYASADEDVADSVACDRCPRTFRSAKKYRDHVKNVHRKEAEKQYKCDRCPKSFQYPKNLANHVSLFHADPSEKLTLEDLTCKKCDLAFATKSAWFYHAQKHVRKESTYTCTACSRQFKSRRGYREHQNLHTGTADHLCNNCGRGFITRQRLVNHMRTKHTLEKSYICDMCGEAFLRSDRLLVHRRRVHTGERPYACDRCDWRGVCSSTLIVHQKRHKMKDEVAARKAAAVIENAAAQAQRISSSEAQ